MTLSSVTSTRHKVDHSVGHFNTLFQILISLSFRIRWKQRWKIHVVTCFVGTGSPTQNSPLKLIVTCSFEFAIFFFFFSFFLKPTWVEALENLSTSSPAWNSCSFQSVGNGGIVQWLHQLLVEVFFDHELGQSLDECRVDACLVKTACHAIVNFGIWKKNIVPASGELALRTLPLSATRPMTSAKRLGCLCANFNWFYPRSAGQ